MKALCLKLHEAMAAQLAAVARARSLSKSAIVRASLDEFLTEGKAAAEGSCLDMAADLVGCVAGARDLSTQKKHLHGYGR
jgi:hypothetical protein